MPALFRAKSVVMDTPNVQRAIYCGGVHLQEMQQDAVNHAKKCGCSRMGGHYGNMEDGKMKGKGGKDMEQDKVLTFDVAIRMLADNLPMFFDITHFLLGDRPTLMSEMGFEITGNENIDDSAAVFGAVMGVLSVSTNSPEITIKIEDSCMLHEYMRVLFSINKLVEHGLASFSADEKDEYGFPAIIITEDNKDAIIKILEENKI